MIKTLQDVMNDLAGRGDFPAFSTAVLRSASAITAEERAFYLDQAKNLMDDPRALIRKKIILGFANEISRPHNTLTVMERLEILDKIRARKSGKSPETPLVQVAILKALGLGVTKCLFSGLNRTKRQEYTECIALDICHKNYHIRREAREQMADILSHPDYLIEFELHDQYAASLVESDFIHVGYTKTDRAQGLCDEFNQTIRILTKAPPERAAFLLQSYINTIEGLEPKGRNAILKEISYSAQEGFSKIQIEQETQKASRSFKLFKR